MRLVFLVLSLFNFSDFVYSGPTENAHPSISIIGGTAPATSGEFPFMASLPLALGSCGGTLIDPSYVLTAAHCVSLYIQSDAVGFPVYLNTLNVLGEADSINATVTSFVVHEGYANVGTGFVNDVALLVLSQPVTTINPIPLPNDSGASTEETATTTIEDTTTTELPTTTTKPTTTTTKTTTKPTTTTTKTTTKPTTTTTKTTTKPTTTTTKTTTKPTTTTTKTTTKPTTTKPTTTKTTTKPKTTTTTKTTTKPNTTTTTKTTTKPKTTMKITTPSPSGTTLSCTCTQTGATSSSGSMTLLCSCSPQTSTAKPTTKKAAIRNFSAYTKKPALRDFSTYENMDAVITGWGVQADGFNSDTLISTGVTIFGNDQCTTKWGSTLFDGSSMMCAAKDGQSACTDDDGGPIIVDGVQVGIASFFPETCGDSNFPAVFTRTSAYIQWIKATMAANPPASQ